MTADVIAGVMYQKTHQRPLTRWRCDGGLAVLEPISYEDWPSPETIGPIAIVHRDRDGGTAVTSHLILGSVFGGTRGTLFVFVLPTLRLVHTHFVEGCGHLNAIAADPAGSSIVLCDDAAGSVKVLPWPLPGMPS